MDRGAHTFKEIYLGIVWTYKGVSCDSDDTLKSHFPVFPLLPFQFVLTIQKLHSEPPV